jgi:hypothetical protein
MVREEPPVYKTRNDWLSPAAREIRAVIQLPVSERTPVGYQGAFLDAYQPNHTFYLPESLRKELEDLGQVGLSALPAGTYMRQVMDRLLIDLSWNSSRLEGNTYSLLETQRLLEVGEDAEGKATQETQMILNHKAAIEMLADEAGEIDFNRYTICNLHALLSDNLLPDPGASGRVRSRPVGISGTVFHPLEVPQQIEERFEQILVKAAAVRNPFEQAFFAMVHLPYLQPFEDVNKRVSRLAANIPLIRYNLCPLSFVDVDSHDYIGGLLGVYELNRVEYLRDVFAWAYRRSCALLGGAAVFGRSRSIPPASPRGDREFRAGGRAGGDEQARRREVDRLRGDEGHSASGALQVHRGRGNRARLPAWWKHRALPAQAFGV